MIYNFSTVKLTDIEGKEMENADAHKTLANAVYNLTTNLDLVEKAMQINKGEEVALTPEEIEVVKGVINDPKTNFFAFVKKAFLDYIDSVK